jgi:hypothetical protein
VSATDVGEDFFFADLSTLSLFDGVLMILKRDNKLAQQQSAVSQTISSYKQVVSISRSTVKAICDNNKKKLIRLSHG